MNFVGRIAAVAVALFAFSGVAFAQGKVAVLNLEEAVFNTEVAKKRIEALRQTPEYTKNRDEAEALQKQYESLAQEFQKNRDVMSAEQSAEQARKLKEIQTDLEFVAKKLQASERDVAQVIMREMLPKANQVVAELIKVEGIGLLLNGQQQIVLHADAGYSINAKVTEKLNQAAQ